uniref:Dynein beta chain, flagellar outer arm-like isoform X6 n=1 Tax=Crassostrea virginica TaxID=6565 RepID=A0A8B8D085_CRAVI|nr:dynein beta chain, flagellar outer arm-like isoform X6 [Crassostrea virginica]
MDERLKWLEMRISSSLRPRNEELKNMFLNDENRLAFYEFINNEDVRKLFVYNKEKQIIASLIPPFDLKYKSIFFLKCNAGTKLTKENIGNEVFYIDCTNIPLEHLELVIREVYLPLMCTNQGKIATGGDKVMDILHRLMSVVEVSQGHVEGRIILSLPSIEVLAEAAATPNRRGAVLHVLETTVLAWIKQIKGVLKHDPIADLFHHYGPEPGPLDEVKMWERQLGRLHSILRQLESPVAKDILQNLDQAQSQYSSSFNHVRKDVNKAVSETNRTLRFLSTMQWLFEDLNSTLNPCHMLKLFKPLMQVLFLVWQHSVYYHQMDKFHNLLRLLSNEVVHRAIAMVGEDILREPLESYTKLKEALRVCAAFRGTYLDFKDKADDKNAQNIAENAERLASRPQGTLFLTKMYGPHAYTPRYGLRHGDGHSSSDSLNDDELWTDSPWPPRNAPCFDLLNSFMERCNDVLELVETTRHFRLLADAAEIGGAGSMSLDALVKEIHVKYTQAMKDFFAVVDNVLSIDGTQNFERAFFRFRTVVKSLEKRLAEILRLSYNHCPTVESQLRLLEVFEGVSGRELVQVHLKDKDLQLVKAFSAELQTVRSMFDETNISPPLHANMPPIASRLFWVRALQERIRRPMEKLKRVSPHSLEGDEGWQMKDAYQECIKVLEEYEKKITLDWQSNITSELTTKLKQPLLIAEEYDEEVDIRPQVVHANLDAELLLLMKEINYLCGEPFNIHLPPSAKELLRNTDAHDLRTTATRLETIVSKYNNIMRSITEFERPLFERKLSKIDILFEQGLQQYTWRMRESADFIEQAMSLVCVDVHQNLDIVQTNCHEIAGITISWSLGSLDVFTSRDQEKSYSMEELLGMQKHLEDDFENMVIPSGHKIHQLVDTSFEAVQISQASPAWQDYIDYVDAIVLDGLKQSTLTSLKSMLNNLVQANMSTEDDLIMPILTIRLELIDNRVAFRPPLDTHTSVISVQELVHQWLDSFLARGKLVKMLGPKGTYQDYIAADEEVKQLLLDINKLVDENGEECKKLIDIFGDYAFLWLQDVNLTFEEFLRGKLSPNPLRSPNRTFAGMVRQQATERSRTESRASSTSSLNSAGLLGTAERTFLTPKNQQEEVSSNIPSLDEFDSEIEIYRTARDEIQSLEDFHNVGWLRVDLQPIKQVLTTYAAKWMWTYTKYLSDQVTHMLEKHDMFLKRIEPEIEGITGEERDTASFMKMMRLFNEVSAQQLEMDGKFTAMHRTVLLLKKYGQKLPEKTQGLFSAAPGRWNNLKTKVSLAKQRLGPRIQEESVRITQDLEAFGERVMSLAKELENSDVYNRDCNISDAWVIIDGFSKRLTVLENEAQDLIELQGLLEASVVNFEILPQCRHELNNLKQVWETVRVIDEQQSEWKRHRWQKMNTKFLKEETNKQLDIVRGLPEDIFTWDVYMGLHESISTIQACLPLIDDLSNPAMRTRHWKKLVQVTKGGINIDSDSLKRMTLGELLGLGLQKHVDDVRAQVQRAVKDLSIEQSLKTYDEVWLSKIFELRPHTRIRTEIDVAPTNQDQQSESDHSQQHGQGGQLPAGSRSQARTGSRISNQSSHSKNKRSSIASLPASLLNLGEVIENDTGQILLLTHTDPIFGELEAHQVSLQAMHSNSLAGSFMDDVVKWQKRLQTIEAVLRTWLDVQELWIELEEVYSSTDVRTSLSHDANRFAVLNKDFRLLMRATEKNPNVLQRCTRKNILSIVEHMKHGLETCRRNLLHHLERRRQIFPRFYFLSMEDVLHIVCNGYDLNQVNLYINKLFENVGSITFEEVEEEERCKFLITGVTSCLGERLDFNQPVACEGQIETWLSSFVTSLKSSLQFQMATALGYEKPKPKRRTIRSAGSRKVSIPARASSSLSKQNKGDKAGSRASSRQRKEKEKEKDANASRASSVAEQLLSDSDKDPQKSWTLDHVAEVVYLATQVQMTEQISESLAALDSGNRDSLKNCLDKINSSIKATVVLLKGLEGDKEAKGRKEKTESELKSNKLGDDKEEFSESASVAGARSSYGGASMGQSRKGSMFDVGLESGRSPIPEEEGSLQDHQDSTGTGGENTQRSKTDKPDQKALVEPQTMEPIDTMNILNMPLPTIKTTQEEEAAKQEEPFDNIELKLMLFPSQIQKLTSLLALMAHLRDFMERMIEAENNDAFSTFQWNSQLRYYYNKDTKGVTVKCLDAEFDYGFEYIGSSQREVITPLTERVFVALCQSIKAHMGGMCVGAMPEDTGKFELVHELSRSLGYPLYRFNCTKTMNYEQLQDIFRGMAATGSWVCFDNYNHLAPAVLSVFAQLMSAVMEALKAGKAAVHLQSDDIQLNPSGACFALLDSALKVQPGNPDKLLLYPSVTAALPDYIMTQFRTVTIVQPDLYLTLEVMLCSQGFIHGRELAKKTMMVYEMCRKLLGTTQFISEEMTQGCDIATSNGGWSIKTLKGVVSEAGAYLEKNMSDVLDIAEMSPIKEEEEEEEKDEEDLQEDGEKHEEEGTEKAKKDKAPAAAPGDDISSEMKLRAEEKSLVMAIRDTFLPRMQGRDASIFCTLITDIWPHVDLPMLFGGESPLSKPPQSRISSRARTAKSDNSARSLKDSINLNTPVVPLAHGAGSRFMVDGQRQVLEDMHDAIAVATGDLGLLPGVAFQGRVAQLAQLNAAHQTIFVVGPAGCGKSECIKTFGFSERERGKTIAVQTLFTKAVESEELMGYFHTKNGDWKDGLLTSLLRKLCIQPASTNYDLQTTQKMKVIQLDGEVDPGQMELLSAVLNNDGAVVLGNNERIIIPETVRFIWEMENVEKMSPAVLANVGILMMTSQDVGWKMMLVQWLEKCDEADKELMTGFCDIYIEKTIEYLSKCCQPHMFGNNDTKGCPRYTRVINHSVENMVGTFTTLLDALISRCRELSDVELERYFNFAAVWAFGGTLEAECRESFSNWWKEQFEQHIDYPEEGTVFDYSVGSVDAVDQGTHEFVRWTDILPSYSSSAAMGIPPEAFVHTVPAEQMTFLLSTLTDYRKSVMLVGENGCGKTAIINDKIRTAYSGEVAEVLSLTIQANRFTNARLLYDRLDERLEWKHGQTYVPKGNKRLLCLVDDINLSQVDMSGQQTAVELVREHIDDGGFYNQDTHAWRYVNSVTYCTTVNPNTTANVPKLSQRFMRHFAVFGVPYPDLADQQSIFSILLQTHFIAPETSSTQAGHHLHDEKNLVIIKRQEEAMRSLLNLIVKVTVELQDRLRAMYLMTSQRCHYLFTMRDLSVLFRNLCLSLRPGCTKKNLMLLWQHECTWVYSHRMVSEVDVRRYRQAFVTAVKKEFTNDEEVTQMLRVRQPYFSNLIEQDSGVVTAGMIDTRHSSNISEEDAKTDLYKPVFRFEEVKELMSKGVEEYNKIHPRIKLALYKRDHATVVEQVCRLARTIASPHETSHSVLVAEGCPGRATIIVKLAAHLCGYTVHQINPTSMGSSTEYKMDQFKADLVQGYTRAGSRGEKVLLLLHEEELLEEDFIVFLQEFIMGGSISHLFTYEEQTTIINSIRTEVTQAGLTYTRDVAWNFFLRTVRSNFRVCFIMNEGKEAFQRRCREFPSFAKNINFLWFPHWSKTQLVEHAQYHFKDLDWMSPIQKENISHMLASMHLVLRQQDGQEKDAGEYCHITNTSYEKFVERYISLATAKNSEVKTDHDSVTKSLNHIKRENEVALKLKKLLEHEMIVLEERKQGTIKILSQIGKDTAITEQQIKVVKAQLDRISRLKKLLPEYQVAHERAVYKAIAIVADTKKVIQNMDIEKLSELRGMNKPILDIEDLMTAIIMILKSPSADLTWQKGAKRQMANLERFIEELLSFDDNQLPEATLLLVEPYLKKPSFDPEAMERKTSNSACGALCKWVIGVVRYHRMMISKVKPLHQKVEETTTSVDEAEHKMATLENKRKSHEVRLNDLARGFEEATIDKNQQEEKTKTMKRKLESAAQLRKILKGERQRCQQIYDSHERREVAIPGGCAMAAAFATYLGPYHHNFRRVMLTIHWPNCLRERGIPLVIDSIDGLKGRVIDWSIDFLKTASGASQVYDIDYTSALLGQNVDQDESNATQPQEEEEEVVMDNSEENKEQEAEDKDGGEEEEKEEGEEKGDKEKSEKEEKKEDTELTAEEKEMEESERGQEKSLGKIPEQEEGLEEDGESEVTQSTTPMITSLQYNKYVLSLIKLLVGERTLNDWVRKDFGPRQIENAAMLCSSWQRPPMMIDPNGEGAIWLGKLNKLMNAKKLVSLDMETRWSDPHVLITLEKGIMRGKPILLTNCDENIDNVITPLIHHRNTAEENDKYEEARMIKFCGRRVLCQPDFRFYLSTPLSKPRFNPEVASTTTLINFGVSHDTLTEDLLTRAFARMRPELYQERCKTLKNLQLQKDTLLYLSEIVKSHVLSNQAGILGSPKALKYITDMTNAKMELANRLNDTQALLLHLNDLKDDLFPLARRAAMLYAIIRSLQSVHNEYQFPLHYFIELFDEAVGGELPPEFLNADEDEGGYEDGDESSAGGAMQKKRRGSAASSQGSKASATAGTGDKQTLKSEKEDGEKDEYGDDFEEDKTEEKTKEKDKNLEPPPETQLADQDYTDLLTIWKKQGDSASTAAAQKLLEGSESDELPPLEIPETVPLPTEGVKYESLSANQIKQVMDKLTGLVYRRIREALYEEDILLFATLLCLNIESEGTENFSNEEMSLLLQGNPGLGMQLTLNDFDCKDPPPKWIPQEKWEDILALSVLPGPLDSLCVHLAQNSESWKAWYKSDYPEREPLPLSSSAGEEENRPASGGSKNSHGNGMKTPDLGPLSDFHQLLLLRMLRQDRLPAALVRYVNKHLTINLPEQSKFNLTDVLQDAKRHLGVLLLLPPSVSESRQHPSNRLRLTKPPVQVLKKMAEAIGAQVEIVRVGDGCEILVDEAIDSADKNDGWVIIQDLHLAPPKFFNNLKKHLIRVSRSRSNAQDDKQKGNRFCVWITSEPCPMIPSFLLQNLHKIAWNHITEDVVNSGPQKEESKDTEAANQAPKAPLAMVYRSPGTYLHSAIVSTLKQVPVELLDKVSTEPQMVRTIAFGLGVIQGMLMARQLFGAQGLNQWYPFNQVQMEQALLALTGKMLKSDEQQAPKVDTMAEIFAKAESPWPTNVTARSEPPNKLVLSGFVHQLVYQNCVLTYSDMDYVEACVKNVLNSLYQDSTGSLVLGSVAIPTPPANVDPVDFGQWYEENVDEEFTLGALQLHTSVERETIDSEATDFIRNLDMMFETQTMEAGDLVRPQQDTVTIMRLRSSLDMCSEELPILLELGQVGELIKHDYNFPYHVPSLMSLATTSSSQMPETIGYCLLQECLWMNNSLCHMRQQIHDLQGCLLAGPEAIPKELLPTACSLQEEHVPVSWIHPNCQPSTHSLVSWLEDLKKRHNQLHNWVKHSMVPVFKNGTLENPTIAAGRLGKVWLGGLVNPQALLVAIRQEKAIIAQCSMSEISFECIVMDNINTEEYDLDEGGMFVSDLHLQAAAWDYENDCLRDSVSALYNIPYIYMKPVLTAEQADKINKQTIYSCPIFMNKSRQVQTTSVNLNCPVPVEKWRMARVALILDPGLPEDGVKKSRSYMMLMKAPMMPMQEEESIRSDEEEEELIELEQGEEVENSEQSQMSYRPMSPKAPPLPPGLALQKESPMVPDQGSSSSKQAVGKQASVKGSKESVYSQGKSEGKRESCGATPTKASEKSAQQSPTPAKPSSRPPTRTSVTSNKSKEKERTVPQEEAKGEGGTSRPRSEHEDPVTQVEIEHSEDEVGGDTERKTQQASDRSSEENQNQNASTMKKSESNSNLKKGSSTQSLLKKVESTKSLNKGESTSSLHKGESTKSLNKGESTKSLNKAESTKSLNKAESTKSLNKAESTKSLKKGESTKSLQKGESTKSLNKQSSTSKESLKKAPSSDNLKTTRSKASSEEQPTETMQKTKSKESLKKSSSGEDEKETAEPQVSQRESEKTRSSPPPTNRSVAEKQDSETQKEAEAVTETSQKQEEEENVAENKQTETSKEQEPVKQEETTHAKNDADNDML